MFKWLGGLVDSNEKELKRLHPIVSRINELEPDFEKLGDAELRAKTDEFKARLGSSSSLDELLPEAFNERPNIEVQLKDQLRIKTNLGYQLEFHDHSTLPRYEAKAMRFRDLRKTH